MLDVQGLLDKNVVTNMLISDGNGANSSNVYVESWKFRSNSYVEKAAFRAFDLLIVAILSPMIVLAILASAVALKLSDPKQPVFFKQTRFGLHGKPFTILKLRTMVPNAEELKAELLALSADKGQGFKIINDPRITRVGRVLRRTYLDELPQFFNVLKGEMSVVGPRANSFAPSTYEPWQLKRLEVKPGLTGEWQVSRSKTYDFRERCRMDNAYVSQKSIPKDLLIIAKTVNVCLFRQTGE